MVKEICSHVFIRFPPHMSGLIITCGDCGEPFEIVYNPMTDEQTKVTLERDVRSYPLPYATENA